MRYFYFIYILPRLNAVDPRLSAAARSSNPSTTVAPTLPATALPAPTIPLYFCYIKAPRYSL
jgi:hypothetical protein